MKISTQYKVRMKNNINTIIRSCLLMLGLGLLLIPQIGHADFRIAVDAYIARDGATMLKEVKDAAAKKDNEGLVLFLSAMQIDASTSRQSGISRIVGGNRAGHFIDEAQVKTTLSMILNESQQDELFKALQMAVDNGSVDAQYDFAQLLRTFNRPEQKDWRASLNEFVKKGSYTATLISSVDLATKAELGDPISQLNLGFKYLNFASYDGYGCWEGSKEIICQTKDETKGFYWLERALINYEKLRYIAFERKDNNGFALYADSMCDFFHKAANGDETKLRQAYLWCVVGFNSGGGSSWALINMMHETGDLKIAAPEIAEIWGISSRKDRAYKILSLTDFKELPDMMAKARKEMPKEGLPVFSYYSSDYRLPSYLLDIYTDGRVNIAFGYLPDKKSDLLIKVSPRTVQNFLDDLKKLDFQNWTLFTTSSQFCDNFDPCIWTHVQATHREGEKVRKVIIMEPSYLAEFSHNNVSTLRIAKLNALLERYFPTQKMRCELGSSEGFRKACIERDHRWAVLAKEHSRETNTEK